MKARLEPVLGCLKSLAAAGVWTEVTTLIVPGMNDSPEELTDIAEFICNQLGPHVPWHVSRFHGDYRMTDRPATPLSTLQAACRVAAKAGLQYVYSGNVPGQANESTFCPKCGALLIDRVGFSIRANRIADGKCPDCGWEIEGVWG
jgi:pyruvate formate lyase activating enzyme